MYTQKEITIIIPTYNREKDLKTTLDSLKHFLKDLKDIIIVDQSKNDLTRKLIKKLKNKKIKYFYSNIPSIPIARNLGIKNTSKDSKLICFIDDDVTLGSNYFEEILKVFNKNPNAKAVGGFFESEELNFYKRIEYLLKKFFFIRYPEKNNARVLSIYGNTYPEKLDKIINTQWIPGVNMVYKKEIFKDLLFDENLKGYALAEDLDFTYRLYKKYPDSLFMTPYPRVVHRYSVIERYPKKEMSYVNQINHFYLNYKNMNSNFIESFIFVWVIFGIIFLRILKLLLTFNNKSYLELVFFLKSFKYCLLNLGKIRRGMLDFQ